MALTKARLNRWDQIVGLEVRHELVSDDLFDDLGDEGDIGNRSEVAWVSWIKSRTFDDGDQDRSFLVQQHDSFYDGSIANWVRSGSKMSRCSCRRNIGKGSSSHDFGAAAMMMRRSSAGVIAVTADRMQVVDGNVGGGEPAVASRMVWTLA